VEIVSPERVLYSGDGDMVVARAADGDIAFLPGQDAKARAEAALRADEHDEDARDALARAETRLEVAGANA
jgi:F0F1-type ATP synthase epsilon subunit